VFGVSAAAAIYRREALERLVARDGAVFDERLGSFYEDVDLAVRLRRDGWSAIGVPAAAARHHGSLTTSRRPLRRRTQIHGNRWLVLARLLGSSFSAARATALRRDLRDWAAALGRADLARAAGVAAGFVRAARRWRHFAHRGAPLVAPATLRRFGAPSLG
jgi:GT2 family glycosyltransferase